MKWLLTFTLLFVSGWASAVQLKTVFNPFTGKPDYINVSNGGSTLPLPSGDTSYVQINPTSNQSGVFNVDGGTVTALIVQSTSSITNFQFHTSHLPINGGFGPQVTSAGFYSQFNVNSGTSGDLFLFASTEPYAENGSGGFSQTGSYLQLVPFVNSTAGFFNILFTSQTGLTSTAYVFRPTGFTSNQSITAPMITVSTIIADGYISVSSGTVTTQLNVANAPSGTKVSSGVLNVNSTIDPTTLFNSGSSESNEANLFQSRWITPITGVTTQAASIYGKFTNTSSVVNPLADGVAAYYWARDIGHYNNGNLYGSFNRVTGQGVAQQYTGSYNLGQWIDDGTGRGSTSVIVGIEVGTMVENVSGVGISTGTVIDVLLDNKVGSGTSGNSWTIYGADADPSWLEGGLEIGTGHQPLQASFIVASTSITATSSFAMIVGTAAYLTGMNSSQYMLTVSTTGVTTVKGSEVVNGPGDGLVQLTIGVSTYTVTYTTAPRTIGYVATYISTSGQMGEAPFPSRLPITVNANYTTVSTNTVIIASAPPSGITITLSTASSNSGQSIIIEKGDASTQTVTIVTTGASGTDLISASSTTFILNAQGQTASLISDGLGNWVNTSQDVTPSFVGDGILPVGSLSIGTSSNTIMQSFTVNSHVSMTGIRIQVQVQSGNIDLAVLDRTMRVLDHTGTIACPSGTATSNFPIPANLAPGQYYLGLLATNTIAQFGRVSQGNIIGSIVFTGTANTIVNQTPSAGSPSNSRYAMVGIVSGGITQ